jgi:alkylation response protein AidB-like acyl-CoA dehydrogenase
MAARALPTETMNILERLDSRIVLNDEESMLLESVRALARDQIAPRAEHYDRSAEFPWEHVKAINELGLNAMFIPEAYGGAQMSYTAYLTCVREISKACAATGIIWATNYHGMKPLIDWGTEEQKQRLLPRIAEGGWARWPSRSRRPDRTPPACAPRSGKRATRSSSMAARPSSPTAT